MNPHFFLPGGGNPRRRALVRLSMDLLALYRNTLRRMKRLLGHPAETRALGLVICQVSTIHQAVRLWLAADGSPEIEAVHPSNRERTHQHIRKLIVDTASALDAEPLENHDARRAWTELLALLTTADQVFCPPESTAPTAPRVKIPVEVLYAAHAGLFPAERMLVASGRREGLDVALLALFDVTGEAQSGYVRANPEALGRALIAMDACETFLAAWLHSHPGAGPLAAHPSQIDQNQHADWLRHYSPHLLCGILVRDGWVRFWGENLETGTFSIAVLGAGIQQEKDHEHLYRLAF